MCVGVRVRDMGCGKSKHRSLEDSEHDLRGNNKNLNSSSVTNHGGNANTNNSSKIKDASPGGGGGGGGKRKKQHNENKSSTKDGEKEEKTSPFKLLSNGKTNRSGGSGRSEEVGVPAGLSASGKTNGSGADKSNGTTGSNKGYALEIPNEINKQDSHNKTTCRDFKSLTASKTVHVTNSQIEFFKMLDEKIEKGDGYTTSADVSEVSSLDENFRH